MESINPFELTIINPDAKNLPDQFGVSVKRWNELGVLLTKTVDEYCKGQINNDKEIDPTMILVLISKLANSLEEFCLISMFYKGLENKLMEQIDNLNKKMGLVNSLFKNKEKDKKDDTNKNIFDPDTYKSDIIEFAERAASGEVSDSPRVNKKDIFFKALMNHFKEEDL